MTNTEKYNTVFSYWQELPTPKTVDESLQRATTTNKIYDALMMYTHLCIREGKEVRM